MDSKCLFDIIGKESQINEKRLMLYRPAARQAYDANQISQIGFARSSKSLAYGLMKPKIQQGFHDVPHTGPHEIVAELWIRRNSP